MSNPPEKKHPWAKFKAKPSAPQLPTARALPRAPLPPAALPSAVAAQAPTAPVAGGKPAPKSRRSETVAKPPAPTPPAVVAKPKAAPVSRSEADKEPGTGEPKPAAEKPAAPVAAERPASPPAGAKPEISAGLASVLSELEKADLDPTVVKRVGRERDASPRQRRWMWYGLKESARNYRRTASRLRAWWRVWRTGSSARVLLAFVVIYGLLATIRKPSDVAVERSRIGEEMGFLQGFLKSYSAAGGPVLAVKPHGGAELYPRGIVMKGEVLNAFGRAPVGGVFTVHVTAPEWNPLEAFYGFPSVYAGGAYFQLERKINFSLYRCSFLIRKNSEREGAILLTRVERAL